MPVKFPDPKQKGGGESAAISAKFKKEHGNTFVTKGNEVMEVERIPLNILPFDLASGGGIPRSRISIFYGKQGSTKSLNLYRAMKTVQAMGQKAVLIQPEHVFDKAWGARVGLNLDDLIIINPDNGEQAADAAEAFLYAEDVGIVGIDSIAMMMPSNAIDSEMSKVIVSGNAPLITKMTNKIVTALSKEAREGHYPAFACVNQIRHQIGVNFGDPEKMPGGFLLGYASSLTCRYYGKDVIVKDVNPQLPCYKQVSGIIKKYRVPIVHATFEYPIAVLEHTLKDAGDMSVGMVDDAPFAMQCLTGLNLLSKDKSGYSVDGLEVAGTFKTLAAIKAAYRTHGVFYDQVNKMLTYLMLHKGVAGMQFAEPTPEQLAELSEGEGE